MQTIERLIRSLGESDVVVRCNALWSLREMGAEAKPALTAIKPFLHDKSEPYLQIVAAGAIGVIDPSNAEAVPVLIAALDDPKPVHRAIACEFLGERRHKSGVQVAMKLFNDDSFTVRFEAANAYGLTFGNWLHVIGICLEMLKDSDYTNRLVGAENLLELKPHIQNDLDVISKAISTANWESRLDLEVVLHQLRYA
jgi:HEAT repeat protein